MSDYEQKLSQFTPSDLHRLDDLFDATLSTVAASSDDDVRQCLSALEGAYQVSSIASGKATANEETSKETNWNAKNRFSNPRYIGSGSFGVVFTVFDNALGMDLAIKLLRPSRNSPIAKQRFLEEARITAGLNHNGIIRLYDSGTIGPIPYMTSAIVSGGSLADFIARHSAGTSSEIACHLLLAVSEAVAFAHSKLTYHRDIKPSNILLHSHSDDHDRPRPVLTDFGLAKKWDKEASSLTLEGDILGTARYMSPEQASGSLDDYNVSSEVFTLGIILFELLTGKHPFDGKNNAEIRKAIVHTPHPSLKRLRPDLSSDMISVVDKALEKDQDRRYETVAAFARDLQRILDGQPVEAASPSLLRLAIWKSRKHPFVAASFVLTVLTICFAAIAIGQAWWNQYQSAQREHKTKIEYVVLFGKLVDDVISSDKDQQTAILESLIEFEKSVKSDLEANPRDPELRHLLSVLYHYQCITFQRTGRMEDSWRARIESVILLRSLRFEYPNVAKYRFQYIFGLVPICPAMDSAYLIANKSLLDKAAIGNQFEIADTILKEIDLLNKDFENPAYEDACNGFRLTVAQVIRDQNPDLYHELTQKVIAEANQLADQHPDSPIYRKHAIAAYWQYAFDAERQGDYDLMFQRAAEASEFFDKSLGEIFDKTWVKAFYLEREHWHLEMMCKHGRFHAAIERANKLLDVCDDLEKMPVFHVSCIISRFRCTFLRYLSKKGLHADDELDEELEQLTSAAKATLQFEACRIDSLTWCSTYQIPPSIISILEEGKK